MTDVDKDVTEGQRQDSVPRDAKISPEAGLPHDLHRATSVLLIHSKLALFSASNKALYTSPKASC